MKKKQDRKDRNRLIDLKFELLELGVKEVIVYVVDKKKGDNFKDSYIGRYKEKYENLTELTKSGIKYDEEEDLFYSFQNKQYCDHELEKDEF